MRVARAVSRLESIPLDRYEPTGTSAARCAATDSWIVARRRSLTSSSPKESSGAKRGSHQHVTVAAPFFTRKKCPAGSILTPGHIVIGSGTQPKPKYCQTAYG